MSKNDDLMPLVFELLTAALSDDPEKFLRYVKRRLDDELTTQAEAYRLVALLAVFAGHAITVWAEDTHREPEAVLQMIALAFAVDEEDDDE